MTSHCDVYMFRRCGNLLIISLYGSRSTRNASGLVKVGPQSVFKYINLIEKRKNRAPVSPHGYGYMVINSALVRKSGSHTTHELNDEKALARGLVRALRDPICVHTRKTVPLSFTADPTRDSRLWCEFAMYP